MLGLFLSPEGKPRCSTCVHATEAPATAKESGLAHRVIGNTGDWLGNNTASAITCRARAVPWPSLSNCTRPDTDFFHLGYTTGYLF